MEDPIAPRTVVRPADTPLGPERPPAKIIATSSQRWYKEPMTYSLAQVRKALAAAVLGGAIALAKSAQSGSVGTSDYIAAVVAALIAGVGVFLVSNAPATK